jgi:hypothetical protein
MDPRRYGVFAWMLVSHKLVRWLVFLLAPLGLVGLGILSFGSPAALMLLILSGFGIAAGLVGIFWPGDRRPFGPFALAGFGLASFAAGFVAWTKALRGELNPIWEPTRRPTSGQSPSSPAVEG